MNNKQHIIVIGSRFPIIFIYHTNRKSNTLSSRLSPAGQKDSARKRAAPTVGCDATQLVILVHIDHTTIAAVSKRLVRLFCFLPLPNVSAPLRGNRSPVRYDATRSIERQQARDHHASTRRNRQGARHGSGAAAAHAARARRRPQSAQAGCRAYSSLTGGGGGGGGGLGSGGALLSAREGRRLPDRG